MSYKHLGIDERIYIENQLKFKVKISEIAKNISILKKQILEPVKRDLLKTDIIFTYELIKVGRKYSKIILNTNLDLEKLLIQFFSFNLC